MFQTTLINKKISDRKDFHHFLPGYSLFKCIYIYRLSKSILSPVLRAYNPSEQLLSSFHCSLCNYWFLSNDTYYLHILKNTYCSIRVPSYICVDVFKRSWYSPSDTVVGITIELIPYGTFTQ